MNRRTLAILALAAILSMGGWGIIGAATAKAAISNWQKGVSIQSAWSGDFASSSFQQSVDSARNDGANYISLILPYYQSNLYSTDIGSGNDTPTDQALASAIDYIHSKGMAVMLTPHLESRTGEWRANINPSDRATWFANYGNMLNHLGQLGAAHHVEDICVGTELIDMASGTINSNNTQQWEQLINNLRGVYPGKLTYGANWGTGGFAEETSQIQFWPSLDYIGISAYYELNTDGSVSSLENAWDGWKNSKILPLSQQWGKPVVFTEIGYKSASGAHYQPWNYNNGGGYDGQEQANDYAALFDYWSKQDFMHGVQLWDWSSNPGAGGQGDTGYTPQNKPAEAVMKQYFGGSTPAPAVQSPSPTQTQPPTSSPTQQTQSSTSGSFSATASFGSNPTAGQNNAINVGVTNTGGSSANDVIVDVEVYNSSNQKAFQQFYEHQNIGSGQTQNFQPSWTPSSSGSYSIKVGVFSSGWGGLLYWNDNASSSTVSNGSNSSNTSNTSNATPNGNGSTGNSSTQSSTPSLGSGIVYVNGYPTVNGNYIDCYGNVDNDMAHHTQNGSDTDPAHHSGQNCPAGSYVATH